MIRVLLLVTGAVWLAVEVRQSRHVRREATTSDRGSLGLVQFAAAAGVLAGIVTTHLTGTVPVARHGVAVWVALGILWSGIALRVWCFRTLGRYFTFTVATSTDQQVISSGSYRMLRHPSYTALLLAVTGIGLFLTGWAGLAVLLVIMSAGLAYRIRIEERALLDTLGERYRVYAATRKRIIPFIW